MIIAGERKFHLVTISSRWLQSNKGEEEKEVGNVENKLLRMK